MTGAQYDLFLSVGAWICALGAIFNLFKLKRRGNSAILMSAAFLMLGAILWMVKIHASEALIAVLGVAVALILIGDVVLRSRQQERPR